MSVSRPYQTDTIERVEASTARRVLIVLPTGGGKTIVARELIRRSGARVLFLAAARELIHQTSEKLAAAGVAHGIIMAGVRGKAADVQVASVQTLARRPSMPSADIVFIDEADLARADSYGKILAHYPHARIIGMTATPWRADGKGLGELFDETILSATPRELIAGGYLVDFGGSRFEPLDTAGVKTTGGDFDKGELGKRATSSADGKRLVGDIVNAYLAHARGRSAVCFAVNVEHSKLLAAQFLAAGIPAEHVDATLPIDERAAILANVRSGVTHVLCNVGILTRGVDIPSLEVAILARPTKSLALYLQCVGRVLRPSPGKDRALILDHAGCTRTHGFPDDARDYTLDFDGKKRTLVASVGITRCFECFIIVESGLDSCPHCGASLVRERQPASLAPVAGTAVDFDVLRAAARAPSVDAIALRDLLWSMSVRGKSAGTASFVWKQRHGDYPSKALMAQARALAGLDVQVAA